MSKSVSFTKKATQKIRYGMVIYYILDRLKPIGLTIKPYFWEREYYIPASDLQVNITPRMDNLTSSFLETSEIENISEHPERDVSDLVNERISDGCLCFGVKHEQEIVAYTWCNLKRCNHKPLQSNLKKTGAYLFDMYTFKAYRGKNIAPYMRHQLYSHLKEMGRTDFFSITDAFNNASIRFKRKLGARPIKLYLYLKAGNFFERNILLRRYY